MIELDDDRYWPITTNYCTPNDTLTAQQKIEILEYFKTNGFNVRQVLA